MTKSLDTLVLEREDGADYTLRFNPGSVAVEYLGTEISDYLRRGFVPQEGESLQDLDRRMAAALAEREENLEKMSIARPVPDCVKELDIRYGMALADYLVHLPGTYYSESAAEFLRLDNGSGLLLVPPDAASLSWNHEYIHAAMKDNPEDRKLASIGSRLASRHRRMDEWGLPLLSSPVDDRLSFVEAAPPAFGCTRPLALANYYLRPLMGSNTTIALRGPITSGALLVGAAAYLLGASWWPLAALPLVYSVAFPLLKVPRTVRFAARMRRDCRLMSTLRERMGEAEGLKVMAFADRQMLTETVGYLEKNDISF